VFFHKDVKHYDLRNKNLVLKYINESKENLIVPIQSIDPLGYTEPFNRKWDKIEHLLKYFCNLNGNCFVNSRFDVFSNFFSDIDVVFNTQKNYSFIYVDEDTPDLCKYYSRLERGGILIVDGVGVKASVNNTIINFIDFTDSFFDIIIYIK
jgi:hypothetical protein